MALVMTLGVLLSCAVIVHCDLLPIWRGVFGDWSSPGRRLDSSIKTTSRSPGLDCNMTFSPEILTVLDTEEVTSHANISCVNVTSSLRLSATVDDERRADISVMDDTLHPNGDPLNIQQWTVVFNTTGKLVGRVIVTFTLRETDTRNNIYKVMDHNDQGTIDAVDQHAKTVGDLMHVDSSRNPIWVYKDKKTAIDYQEQTSVDVTYDVLVMREDLTIQTIFIYLVGVFIIINNIAFGCVFEIPVAKQILKRPVAPIIGLLLQFLLQPTVAFALTVVTGIDPVLGVALFILGTCPGGGQSNMWTLFAHGDVTLSVVMTFCSMMISIGMMPLWLLTLGQYYTSDTIQIPYLNVFVSLLLLVLPLLGGVAIRHYLPKVAKVMAIILRPMCAIYIFALVGLGIASHLYVFDYLATDWRIAVCVLGLPYFAIAVSSAVSYVAKQSWPRVRTIAIETAIQNAAIALVIIEQSLDKPDSDVALVIALFAIGFAPTLPIIYIFVTLMRQWFCGYTPDVTAGVNEWDLKTEEEREERIKKTDEGIELQKAEQISGRKY